MSKYEVCPGQAIRTDRRTVYPSGSIVPARALSNLDELVSLGVIRVVDCAPSARPVVQAEAQPETAPHAGFDASDPSSVKGVPLRWLDDCLKTVDDVATLQAMHDEETRKGGRDRIEERIGELETA